MHIPMKKFFLAITLALSPLIAHAAGAAEPRPRPCRNNIHNLAAAIEDHDLVVDDEEAVVAEVRENVDQRREGRDCRVGWEVSNSRVRAPWCRDS